MSAQVPPAVHIEDALGYIERQLDVWPADGMAFEQLRADAPGTYEELKRIVFELMAADRLAQRYDSRERKMKLVNGYEWVPHGATWLRTSVEFAKETSRQSGNQIVFQEGGDAFLLRRSPFRSTVEGRATMGTPPGDARAPLRKSTAPPIAPT